MSIDFDASGTPSQRFVTDTLASAGELAYMKPNGHVEAKRLAAVGPSGATQDVWEADEVLNHAVADGSRNVLISGANYSLASVAGGVVTVGPQFNTGLASIESVARHNAGALVAGYIAGSLTENASQVRLFNLVWNGTDYGTATSVKDINIQWTGTLQIGAGNNKILVTARYAGGFKYWLLNNNATFSQITAGDVTGLLDGYAHDVVHVGGEVFALFGVTAAFEHAVVFCTVSGSVVTQSAPVVLNTGDPANATYTYGRFHKTQAGTILLAGTTGYAGVSAKAAVALVNLNGTIVQAGPLLNTHARGGVQINSSGLGAIVCGSADALEEIAIPVVVSGGAISADVGAAEPLLTRRSSINKDLPSFVFQNSNRLAAAWTGQRPGIAAMQVETVALSLTAAPALTGQLFGVFNEGGASGSNLEVLMEGQTAAVPDGGFTPGQAYYANASGALSDEITDAPVGRAISTTELRLDFAMPKPVAPVPVSPVIVSGPLSINGSTTDPVKSSTPIFDNLTIVDDGTGWVNLDLNYAHITQSGASDGSGDYLFNLPSGYTFDLNQHPEHVSLASLTGYDNIHKVLSVTGFVLRVGFYNKVVGIVPYSATQFKLGYHAGASDEEVRFVSSARFRLGVDIVGYKASVRFKKG